MRSQYTKLEEGLREIDPLGSEGLDRVFPSEDADELLARVLASDPRRSPAAASPGPHRGRRGLSGRRVLVPVAMAAVALFAVIVGLPGGGSGDHTGLPALERVAVAAAAQPSPTLDLPYLYEKTREFTLDTSVTGGQAWSVNHDELDETWIAKDGSGRVRRVLAPQDFVGPEDREAWEAAGRPNFLVYGFGGHAEEKTVPPGTYDDELLRGDISISDLPTDSTELADWLAQTADNPRYGGGAFPLSVKSLVLAAEILQNPRATPELRAALYEAAAQTPGVEYLGPATDRIGRRGVAVGATSANSGAPTLYSLIFDPRTSQVLATEQTMLAPPRGLPYLKTPMVTSAKLFIDSGATDSPGTAPDRAIQP